MRNNLAAATVGGFVLAAGLTGAVTLSVASAPPTWAWILAWAAVGVGLILVVEVIWGPIERRIAAHRKARAARARYVPPKAREVTYNEGRWWFILDRGSRSAVGIRCQVFDPIGRDVVKSFGEMGTGPVVVTYPNDFRDVHRPLPSGSYTVVWTLDTEETDRATFVVNDDAGALNRLRDDLRVFRDQGQGLLDELPDAEFSDWNRRATPWASMLDAYFGSSSHLGKPEALQLEMPWSDEPSSTWQESASAAMRHRIGRIDRNMERFGQTPLSD